MQYCRTMLDDPAILVFAPLIVLAAYVIFGVTGFGSTLVAVPLLAHVVPLKFAIPVVVLLDCFASVSQGLKLRADIDRREVVALIPFLVAGMAVGTLLLVSVPGELLMTALGVLVLIYGASYFFNRGAALKLPRWSAAPIGLFGGTTAALFGSGGPVYVIYFAGRGATPDQIRATMPLVFVFTTVARIAVFALAGLFVTDVFIATALLLPAMALGLWLGNRLHGKLARDQAVQAIGAVLTLSGLSLLLRNL
jgi:uncharacterized membrane protein YfcA